MRNRMNGGRLVAKLFIALAFVAGAVLRVEGAETADLSRVPQLKETAEQRDARMQWWRDAKFGMFLHWGPVSLSGKELGWASITRRATGITPITWRATTKNTTLFTAARWRNS